MAAALQSAALSALFGPSALACTHVAVSLAFHSNEVHLQFEFAAVWMRSINASEEFDQGDDSELPSTITEGSSDAAVSKPVLIARTSVSLIILLRHFRFQFELATDRCAFSWQSRGG